jgi:pectate lyase
MKTVALWLAAAVPAAVLGIEAAAAAGACDNPPGGYEGFGRYTTGGAGKSVYRVNNLDDRGAGSLRDALSQGNRCVVFDVGGTILLTKNLRVQGANLTIDGLSAPSPGITLLNRTLVVQGGGSGAGNVVVRGIRHRGGPDDGIRIYGASNVVVDRVSVSGAGDGAIDITEKSHDITVQWSIFGQGVPHNNLSLIKYDASRITVHHNLYTNGQNRAPHCARNDTSTSVAPELVCDVRNNLVWNYYKGTEVRAYGTANVVNNYYYTSNRLSDATRAIYIEGGGVAYVSGNYSQNGWDINRGNRSTAFDADVPTTTDAVTAAKEVLAKAGARGPRFGLDSTDQDYIGQISLTALHAGSHDVIEK